jgi:hypothetical protein
MKSALNITHVRIQTDEQGWQSHTYDLDAPIVVLWGPVDTGKSSLAESIAFALGRDVAFKGTVHKHLKAVEVGVRVGAEQYTLTRSRTRKSKVIVRDSAHQMVDAFPVVRQGDEPSLSSWLLDKLGLDDAVSAVRAPASRQGLTLATGLLPFLYLHQDDIDRQIIMPPSADTTRIAVTRLLLGLTTADRERRRAEITDADNKLKRLREEVSDLEEFLDADPATNLAAIDQEIASLTQRRAAALARTEASRDQDNAVRLQDAYYKGLIEQAHEQWFTCEEERRITGNRFRAAQTTVQTCQEALATLAELETRPQWQLGVIKGTVTECAYCKGPVPREPVQPGQCFMCGGMLCGVIQPGERARLEQVLNKADTDLTEAERAHATASEAADDASAEWARVRRQCGEHTRFPFPAQGAVEDAARDLGAIDGRIVELGKARQSADRLTGRWNTISKLETEQEQRKEDLAADDAGIANLDVLDHLNEILHNIVARMELPNWTGRARINPITLLPEIDGMAFNQRGGGATTAVTIAYSLALLTHTLEQPQALLPGLLILDSPRKNFGASSTDSDLADRIYQQILSYPALWAGARGRNDRPPCQIIIIDNDDRVHDHAEGQHGKVPRDLVQYHRFDAASGTGFIRDLNNPHDGFAPDTAEQLGLPGS